MTVKSFFLASPLILIVFALVFNSCQAPKYYSNAQKDFPAIVHISSDGRSGSGVIVTKEGYVLTSKYLLNGGKSANVTLNNGATYQGTVATTDDARDIAIIKLPDNPAGYPNAKLGSSTESNALQLSSPVMVLGYPADNKTGQASVSSGTICGFPKIDAVQLLRSDTKIDSAVIGGPMTNSDGDVIGIINSQYTDLKGSCSTFATASSEAQALLDSVAGSQLAATLPATLPPMMPATVSANTTASTSSCADVGCLAPDFSLPTTDLRELTLSSLRGKKVIVAFLSTTCNACLQTVECLLPLYASWPRDQLEMVFVISGEQYDDVQSWVSMYDIKCPVLLDSSAKVLNLYKPDQHPALYFLTTDGHIKVRKFPPIDDCTKQFDALLRQY